MMTNERRQHAVGQGFFHTARLLDDERPRLRYVYDCGAMKKYEDARNERIDAYIESVGVGRFVDLLFLSHVHFDHVSGVERLLAPRVGLTVDTIVLPLLDAADRLIAYGRAAGTEPGAVGGGFYRDFVADPAAALSRFGPRQIIFVRRGGTGGGAPGSGGPDRPDRDDDRPSDISGRRSPQGASWKLVGGGRSELLGPAGQGSDAATPGAMVGVVDDTFAIATHVVPGPGSGGGPASSEWLLAPFVDPIVAAKRRDFIRALARARSQTVTGMERWLEDVGNVHELLVDGLPDLVSAYAAMGENFNVTSLCLYSGPHPERSAPPRSRRARAGRYVMSAGPDARVAWLGTGDAALASPSRSKAFSKHYGRLLEEVTTLSLPHHGSDHNLDRALLGTIDADVFVAAADEFSKWRHPGSKTVQAVASRGCFVSTVTSAIESEVEETVRAG